MCISPVSVPEPLRACCVVVRNTTTTRKETECWSSTKKNIIFTEKSKRFYEVLYHDC